MVPRRGLEPPRLSPLVPETSASTNSAIWADHKHLREPRRGCQRLRTPTPRSFQVVALALKAPLYIFSLVRVSKGSRNTVARPCCGSDVEIRLCTGNSRTPVRCEKCPQIPLGADSI